MCGWLTASELYFILTIRGGLQVHFRVGGPPTLKITIPSHYLSYPEREPNGTQALSMNWGILEIVFCPASQGFERFI